ncbi:MAG: hypothetical protein ACI9YL_002168 [Luteibaculaceae bacterium]|jgi:hypothetical protein
MVGKRQIVWGILIPLFCFLYSPSKAQSLAVLADSLRVFRKQSVETENLDEALYWNEKVGTTLLRIFHYEASFEWDFSKVPSFGVIDSPDKYFRLFNWNLQKPNGDFLFFSQILVNPSKKAAKRVYTLNHKDSIYLDPERVSMDQDQWMGALYYEIIPQKVKNGKVYTLLGWMGTDGLTSSKVIETLSFRGQKLRFGVPAIKVNRRSKKRLIFTYKKGVKMGLKWDQEEEHIVYDVLGPKEERFAEYREFYAPTFTFNSLVWEKGNWILNKDVDYQGPENKKIEKFKKKVDPK